MLAAPQGHGKVQSQGHRATRESNSRATDGRSRLKTTDFIVPSPLQRTSSHRSRGILLGGRSRRLSRNPAQLGASRCVGRVAACRVTRIAAIRPATHKVHDDRMSVRLPDPATAEATEMTPYLWALMAIGVGGYILGRSLNNAVSPCPLLFILGTVW